MMMSPIQHMATNIIKNTGLFNPDDYDLSATDEKDIDELVTLGEIKYYPEENGYVRVIK